MGSILVSLFGSILRNLWAASRLILFLPVHRSEFRFGPGPLAAAWVLALLSYVLVQLYFVWPVGEVSPWGVSYLLASYFCSLGALHLGAILIGRGRQSGRLQVMSVSAVPLTNAFALVVTIGVMNGTLPPEAWWSIYASLALLVVGVVRATARLGRPLAAGLVPGAILVSAMTFSDLYLQPLPVFEAAVDYSEAEGEADAWTPVDVEAVYYAQSDLMDAELAGLRAGTPGQTDLFAVLVAYYPEQRVFLREVEAAGSIIADRFDSRGRVVRLANSRAQPDRYPLANRRNLDAALSRIAGAMNPDEDVALVYLTSHGSEELISAGYWEVGTPDLDAEGLSAAIAASGIRNAVVVISACKSGSFIPSLAAPDRLIITASAAGKNSFGCSDESEWTYFGRAFFEKGLATTRDIRTAFRQAAGQVAEWEREGGQDPSEPQIALGPEITPVLERLAAGE